MNSQLETWARGGETIPGGLDDLGRRTPNLSITAFQDTQPWLGDKQAAPRAPRIHRLAGVGLPSCSGNCEQGRGRCSCNSGCIVPRLEPIDIDSIEAAGHSAAKWLCVAILLVMVPALVFGVRWADVFDWIKMIGGVL